MAKNGNGAILGFENKLWDAANNLWANSGLKPSQFAPPVLGLILTNRNNRLSVGDVASG